MKRRCKAVKETPQAASADDRRQLFVVGKEPDSQLARENLQGQRVVASNLSDPQAVLSAIELVSIRP